MVNKAALDHAIINSLIKVCTIFSGTFVLISRISPVNKQLDGKLISVLCHIYLRYLDIPQTYEPPGLSNSKKSQGLFYHNVHL